MPTQSDVPPAMWDEYSGGDLLAVAVAFIVLSTFFVGLRFFARVYLRDMKMGWDDYFIIPGYIAELLMCAGAIVHIKYGNVGWHFPRVVAQFGGGPSGELDAIYHWGRPLFALYFFWNWATVFPRLAIIALYLRIFPSQRLRYVCYGLAAFIVAYGVAFQLAAIFQCWPISYAWDKAQNGKCINVQLFFQLSTVPIIVSDVPLLLAPIPSTWKLETTKGKRIGILFTFALGGFGLVASCLRLAFFSPANVLTDPTWASVRIVSWTTIEPGLYLIAACLIAMRPFLAIVFPRNLKQYMAGYRSRPSNGLSKQPSNRDTTLNLTNWSARGRGRGYGFGHLEDDSSDGIQPSRAEADMGDHGSLNDGIDNLAWPSRTFQDAITVKKEVWVQKTPVPEKKSTPNSPRKESL